MPDDPILARVRDALRDMYGDNIERIVLFGSRARGDAREDSDYDIAVFLKELANRRAEYERPYVGNATNAIVCDGSASR